MTEKFLFFTIYYRNVHICFFIVRSHFKNKKLETLDFMYAGQCGNGLSISYIKRSQGLNVYLNVFTLT